ncbi:MAG: hypothetical protein ACFFBP_13580 [Promethearchaeota archaeon]
MAIFGSEIARVSYPENMTCDACHSKNIKDHELGQVCGDCGIVLERVKLEYHRPYNEEVLQHAVLGGTTMGTMKERLHSSRSLYLNKLNKLHSIQDSEDAVNTKARKEIKRIFEHLQLPKSKIELAFLKFKDFRSSLLPGTKYRSPEKLVPITIYFCMKLNNISISESELLEVSQIRKKEFNAFKLQITRFMPEYAERNRKDYILQKIMEIREHFSLDMVFYYRAKAILYKLWNTINCTKDEVIAGLACSITTLCCYQEREDISVNSICSKLGIMMSTIQSQVKRKIIDRYKIPNFISLVKSSDILKKILIALKIIEEDLPVNENENVDTCKIIENDFIEIKLMRKGLGAFSHDENDKYYHFALKDVNDNPIFIEIKTKARRKLDALSEKKYSRNSNGSIFEFGRYRYFRVKGPPV